MQVVIRAPMLLGGRSSDYGCGLWMWASWVVRDLRTYFRLLYFSTVDSMHKKHGYHHYCVKDGGSAFFSTDTTAQMRSRTT
jgi:hypothetical protein